MPVGPDIIRDRVERKVCRAPLTIGIGGSKIAPQRLHSGDCCEGRRFGAQHARAESHRRETRRFCILQLARRKPPFRTDQ
jgi:hypothetical protein